MSKQKWKAGNMIYPLPAVMVSCGTEEKPNIVTVAWTGTICTNPAMTYISLRKTRFSYNIIKESGVFTINLTTRKLVKATDFCGVRSGRDYDKFQEMHLTPSFDEETGCAMIEESPVNIVCRVTEIKELGSHDMFLAEVVNVYVDDKYMDEKGKFHLNSTDLIAYSHGAYFTLGQQLGTFGYSVMKPKTVEKKKSKKTKKK
ncbi:MAG: flavin reductase family protein [Cellulosilyticaceae bacterium]